MKGRYKVYMHIFPDGKKYIGSTCRDLKTRWNNGRGYYYQDNVFNAICRVGWNNVRHYLLFDDLSKSEANVIENALIKKYKSYKYSYGYNTSVYNVPHNYSIPKYKLQRVDCSVINGNISDYSISHRKRCTNMKPVMVVETEEIFECISDAARVFMVTPGAIMCALSNPEYTSCGYHWKYVSQE